MTVKVVSLNVHGHRIDLAAYGEKFIGDDDYLCFGDDEDVTARWDGTNLKIMPLTDDAGAITVGDGTTNMDFILYGPSSGKFHWDQSANVLYVIATTMMGYGSQFQFSPGEAGAGTGISFYNTSQYIRALTSSVLDISTGAYIYMRSKVVLGNKIQLQLTTDVATEIGELYLDSADARLTYNAGGATEYKVPMYHPVGGNLTLPTGIGLVLTDGMLRLAVGTTVATTLGEIYIDSADGLITYHGGAEYKVPNFAPGGNVVLPSGVGLIMGGKLRLYVGTVAATTIGEIYVDTADGLLTYHGGAEYKIPNFAPGGIVNLPTGVGMHLGSFLKLWNTATVSSEEGAIWYDEATNSVHFWNGAAERSLDHSSV